MYQDGAFYAVCEESGSLVYGNTPEEAKENLIKDINLWLH